MLIPWRPQPSRTTAFDTVVQWYRTAIPDADIRTIDCRGETFNLSECRNLGVRSVTDPSEVVVINDADTLPEAGALRRAIAAAATSGLVHLPYTAYHWLGASGSAQLARGVAAAECDFELVQGACSGVYVTTPETWWAHGGQDEGFRGWGFEDAAWYLAHRTLLGAAPTRHEGAVYALHHVAEVRAGVQYDANAARMDRYRAAADDPDAMRALTAG